MRGFLSSNSFYRFIFEFINFIFESSNPHFSTEDRSTLKDDGMDIHFVRVDFGLSEFRVENLYVV